MNDNKIDNQSIWLGKTNTPIIQDSTFTSDENRESVIVRTEDKDTAIWQVMIVMFLALLTTTYIGKCIYRVWKSRTLQSNVNAAESDTCTTTNGHDGNFQRPRMYELAETVADDSCVNSYDEIYPSGTLPNQILGHENMPEDVITNVSSSLSTTCSFNEEKTEIHLDKDDAYISPCM